MVDAQVRPTFSVIEAIISSVITAWGICA